MNFDNKLKVININDLRCNGDRIKFAGDSLDQIKLDDVSRVYSDCLSLNHRLFALLSQFNWENADDLLSNEKPRLSFDRSIIISACTPNICPVQRAWIPVQASNPG